MINEIPRETRSVTYYDRICSCGKKVTYVRQCRICGEAYGFCCLQDRGDQDFYCNRCMSLEDFVKQEREENLRHDTELERIEAEWKAESLRIKK